jgi:hypothetical protein
MAQVGNLRRALGVDQFAQLDLFAERHFGGDHIVVVRTHASGSAQGKSRNVHETNQPQ